MNGKDSPVKTEVKQEEENLVDDPELLSDPEDYLEQNESLDMNLSNGNQKVWLVKLPRYLAEKWTNQPQDIMGQQLGKVKIKKDRGVQRVKLELNDSTSYNDIPHEYDISMLNTQVRNSYVFGEENLKRFKTENTEMSGDMPEEQLDEPSGSQNQFQSHDNRVSKPRNGMNVQKNIMDKDGKPIQKTIPFVKTIPKKTTLYGKICHDCQIRPSITDNKYNQYSMRKQNIQPAKERPKVVFLDEIPGVAQSNAGPSIKGKSTSVFLKSTQPRNKNEGRAIRMPKKDLLDLLFRLFEEYEYWSIKGLRERTKQPESYLKECLESIANLIKKGPYTSKYNLKPEYKKLRDAERAAKAGQDNNDTNGNDENNEEEDEDMEDVL